jgi:hypothetical protein
MFKVYKKYSLDFIFETIIVMLTILVCEFLCPTLISMFGPWLEPWYEGWNTDHRSLKLPWLATDTSISALMVDALVECIIFVLDTMPGENTSVNNYKLLFLMLVLKEINPFNYFYF